MTTKISIKNLKYADFASQETHCFGGTVYVDGKRFCYASNDGKGGADFYQPLPGFKGNLHAEIEKLNETIKRERIGEYEGPVGPDFEWAVSEAVTDALYLRDMKQAMRRQWLYLKPNDPGLWQVRRDKSHPGPADMVAVLQKHVPGAKLLNALPEDEALEIWRAQG